MRHIALILGFLGLVGCGSGSTSFDGVWDGSYTSLINNCPFSVNQDINPLFPMTVSIDANNVYTVTAVDGSVATGGQGLGEGISFAAQSPTFGDYGSIAPYTCESILSEVGYLADGEDKAKVTLTVYFTTCSTPSTTETPVTCGVIYYGAADRIG